ncbi:histidinol-phosphate aminotransferase [Luteibacter sp. Sphag1AF]|uniref:histidinol-phosphate transaminase n=1 Tax=Luteibacter sp. Sphag1AF TaxID=2587031 RepID=UPI00160FF709|nr:histidinol-phosphate transaminase [Luteibacter sp. Sphag1AF]MBB3227083.1 histidinol-phosphate aminotransferase [Luteibacter sp. Sphag1AF]
MSVLNLARPDIVALTPYASARMEASGGSVFLNANESAWAPPGGEGLNRYPDPQPAALVAKLADLYGVPADRVLVGRGSDEAIDLLVRAFCRAGTDAVLISPPTFGMYAVSARVQGAAVIEVPLRDDFSLDADALLAAVTPTTRLVFVCSPNNPTGNLVPASTLERLAVALEGRALLIVDEAYVEFTHGPRAAPLIDRFEHVAVLRTLSKAWALAGARVGALIARPEIISLLRRIMAPYPLPRPSIDAALAALSDEAMMKSDAHVVVVRHERERMFRELSALPCVKAVLPSDANFLAVRFDDPHRAYAALLAAGVLVRDLTRYRGLSDALRITIGTAGENDRVIATLSAEAMQA